jgi:hypothetical protein
LLHLLYRALRTTLSSHRRQHWLVSSGATRLPVAIFLRSCLRRALRSAFRNLAVSTANFLSDMRCRRWLMLPYFSARGRLHRAAIFVISSSFHLISSFVCEVIFSRFLPARPSYNITFFLSFFPIRFFYRHTKVLSHASYSYTCLNSV